MCYTCDTILEKLNGDCSECEFVDLSRVTRGFVESVIREMTRVARRHPGTINLAQGFPDFPAPEEVKEAAVKAIRADVNQYAVTWGKQALREAICEKLRWYNGVDADPDANVTVCCGSTEAMFASLMAVVNPGDEVVVFEPFYENYGPDCKLSGATPRHVRLDPPNWELDEEVLKEAFSRKTKAIVINTPNNPTGKVFSREELRVVADLCVDYDAIAITDEIYEHVLYDGERHVSIASFPEMHDRSVTINSISKTYSLTGWRVGWAVACDEITREVKKVHDFLTVGAAAPLQEAAVVALTLDRSYYEWLADFYENARETLLSALDLTPFEPFVPKGAYYVLCDCREYVQRRGIATSAELAIHLVKEFGVATVPGASFYASGERSPGRYLTRFCFCKKPETLSAAAERLRAVGTNS
ncbi:MAG: aminotransferase class I/II-fold pyridoxal phosphate-dependent enzyme [Promethearchaeota archaeon]